MIINEDIKNINKEYFEKINNCKVGESVDLIIDNSISRSVYKCITKRNSMESLFKTCLIENSDVTNKVKVEKVLNMYCENELKYDELINLMFFVYCGEDYRERIFNHFNWKFDYLSDKLTIKREKVASL